MIPRWLSILPSLVLLVPLLPAVSGLSRRPWRLNKKEPSSSLVQRLVAVDTITRRGGAINSNTADADQLPIQFFIFKGGLCPFAGRTWIVLLELGLQCESTFVDYQKEARPQALFDVSPRGMVPALYNPNDGATVYESAICNEYLCDFATTTTTLMPSSAADRAKVRLLNDQFDKDVFPKIRAYTMNEDASDAEKLRQDCLAGLDLLETSLAGPYFLGQDFTLADVHIVPFFMRFAAQLRHTQGFEITEERYPKLLTWYKLCQTRLSVQTATIPDEKIIEVYDMKVKMLKSKKSS